MDNYVEKYLKEIAKKRSIAIWGVGRLSVVAEEILENLNINEYVFFDNDESKTADLYHGKPVYNEKVLSDKDHSKYFILISTRYYYEIAQQLTKYFLRNMYDFMNALRIDWYSQIFQSFDVMLGIKRKVSNFGNQNCSFRVCDDGLEQKDNIIVYSFGIGEDLSFSMDLANRYSRCNIYAFDPTPKAVEYLKNCDKSMFNSFYFKEIGLSDKSCKKAFYLPENPEYVSGSEIKHSQVNECDIVEVQMYTLHDIMEINKHDHIDILKLDIEGSEFGAVPQFLKEKCDIDQICLELHDRFLADGEQKRKEIYNVLRAAGYSLIDISITGEEVTFVKESIIKS